MTIKSDNPEAIGGHVFERAGLGPAPYVFLGMFEKVFQAVPGAPKQPGTNCHYCGTGIMYAYELRAANGHKFHVGCDCIDKSGDAGLIHAYKTSPQHRALQANKRRAKDEANKAEIARLLEEKRDALAAQTHVMWNGTQESMHDFYVRVIGYCGAAGRSRYLKALRAE